MSKQRPLRKDALAKVIQVEKPELPNEQEVEKPQAKLGNTALISQLHYILLVLYIMDQE